MTVLATIANIPTLIKNAEVLKVTTTSGSVYEMERNGYSWNVLRKGVEGSTTFHYHVKVLWRPETNALIIGPWHTTGLASVEVL